jgi:hypothetical protein
MSSDITKLGSSQIAAVTARASKVTRALADENAQLREKNASLVAEISSYQRRDQVRKLASQMEEKGLNADMTFDEKVASIFSYEDLGAVQEAIKLAGSGNIGLPEVTDDLPGRGSDAQQSLHSYFVHGAGA